MALGPDYSLEASEFKLFAWTLIWSPQTVDCRDTKQRKAKSALGCIPHTCIILWHYWAQSADFIFWWEISGKHKHKATHSFLGVNSYMSSVIERELFLCALTYDCALHPNQTTTNKASDFHFICACVCMAAVRLNHVLWSLKRSLFMSW